MARGKRTVQLAVKHGHSGEIFRNIHNGSAYFPNLNWLQNMINYKVLCSKIGRITPYLSGLSELNILVSLFFNLQNQSKQLKLVNGKLNWHESRLSLKSLLISSNLNAYEEHE